MICGWFDAIGLYQFLTKNPSWLGAQPATGCSVARRLVGHAYGLLMRKFAQQKAQVMEPSDLKIQIKLATKFCHSPFLFASFGWLRLETCQLAKQKKSKSYNGGCHTQREAPFYRENSWVQLQRPIEIRLARRTLEVGGRPPPIHKNGTTFLFGWVFLFPLAWKNGGRKSGPEGLFFCFNPSKLKAEEKKQNPSSHFGLFEFEKLRPLVVGCLYHWVISAQLSFQSFRPNSFVVFDQAGRVRGEGVFLGNPKDSDWEDWGTLGNMRED